MASLHRPRTGRPRTALAAALVAVVLGAGCEAPVPDQETDTGEPEEQLGEARLFATVGEAVNDSCSTGSVRGLSLQIIEQGRCIEPDAFTEVPDLANFTFGENVFPFLEAPARDALVDAGESTGMSITFNSMLRTVAQQYLLHRWDQQGRCGIAIAATPGNSNHETGLAFDTSQYSAWRNLLESHGFRWYGSGDAVHFDYVGAGAVDYRGVDVKAFQMLWNRNHPDDLIDEDGVWGPQTAQRMQQSPADGFAQGPDCGDPAPADAPDLVTTISAVDAVDVYTDGASAAVADVFEGDEHAVTVRLENRGSQPAGGVVLGVMIDDPWLVAGDYVIESDWQHPGEFEENDSNQAPENPPHGADLPRAFDLVVYSLSPGETKRVTFDVRAVATSVQQGTQPGVRAWVKHVDDRYDQASFGGEVSGDGSQTHNGGRLEVAMPLDVYARTRWEWETDRREGWSGAEPTSASILDGALVVDGAARSPALDLGGDAVSAVRLRAMRTGGTGDARLVLLADEDDALDDGETFALDLPADGEMHEIEVFTRADVAPAAIAIEPFEGDGGELRLDWVRIDRGDAVDGGDDGAPDGDGAEGDDGGFPSGGAGGGEGDAASGDDAGCSCRAAAAPEGRAQDAALVFAALGLTLARRRRAAGDRRRSRS